MHDLSGKRVLVVEDDYLIGMMVAGMLSDANAEVVGPARTRSDAVAMSRSERLDAAVLDLNLRGESSESVAAELSARRIPFLFATGYGDRCSPKWVSAPIIAKPFTEEMLLDTLERLLQPEDTSHRPPPPTRSTRGRQGIDSRGGESR